MQDKDTDLRLPYIRVNELPCRRVKPWLADNVVYDDIYVVVVHKPRRTDIDISGGVIDVNEVIRRR